MVATKSQIEIKLPCSMHPNLDQAQQPPNAITFIWVKPPEQQNHPFNPTTPKLTLEGDRTTPLAIGVVWRPLMATFVACTSLLWTTSPYFFSLPQLKFVPNLNVMQAQVSKMTMTEMGFPSSPPSTTELLEISLTFFR